MKKKLLTMLSLVSLLLSVLSLYAAFTVTGSGFLDASNLGRIAFLAAAAFFSISALASILIASKS